MDDTRDKLRAWLREIVARTGLTATEIARRSGVNPTTLTRFLSKPDASTLSSTTVARIAHATGSVAPSPAGAPRVPQPTPQGLSEAEAEPFRFDGSRAIVDAAVRQLIGERNSADPWVLRTDALALAGYVRGDIAIVDLAAVPVQGDVVCAQVYRWREGQAETVFRLYEPPYIVAASLDPALRKPLIVDNDRVIIKGVVTELLRPRHART